VKEGHVEQVAVEREGKRERTRYRITRSGRRHFEELLRRAWRELPSPAEPIQLALAARPELAEGEVEQLLDERRDALRARLAELGRLRRAAPAEGMVDRQRALTLGELAWLEQGGNDMTEKQPDVQVISNLVVRDDDGHVLLVRYDPDDERWWLPGRDVVPYTHPDEAAAAVLGEYPGLDVSAQPAMAFVESFRGRRGWHMTFNYTVAADGTPGGEYETGWFPADELPRTVHGKWERTVVERAAAA
jgi:ADP-ribose pyrophosphatase YjhB (NUDIX family)